MRNAVESAPTSRPRTPIATPAPTTIPALLAARAAAEPERAAIVADGRPPLTFAQWQRRSTALAHGLHERELRHGERVGLCFGSADWIDYAVAYCAVQQLGAVAVPLSDRLAPAVLRNTLAHCGATGLLHGGSLAHFAFDGWSATAADLEHVCADGCADTQNSRQQFRGNCTYADLGSCSFPETASNGAEVRPSDLAQIIYTSGTTATPKGVSASHANLTFGYDLTPRHRPLAHSRHFLHAFPIGTNAGQTMLVNALVTAATALCADRFEAAHFCRLIESYQVGTVFLVPAMAIELVNNRSSHDLSSVVLVGSTASPLPAAVAAALPAVFPNATIVNNYTSTEAAPAHTTMVVDPDRPTSVGRPPRAADLMIADETGAPLPAGEVGEVLLRSPTQSRAYYGDDRGSAEVFRDGWVRMGDLGYLDSDGYLHLVDRESDVIKTGAYKVSTLQVESALYEHPAVAEAAALGIAHPVMGMMVAAAVVPRSPVTSEELRTFLAQRLAQHELPTRTLMLEALPRNEGGKVLKRELRSLFETTPAATSEDAPATAGQETLRGLWLRVLTVPKVGVGDDFFALGGDSLRANQLATLAAEAFGVDVPSSLAFDQPVLARQAEWIEGRLASATSAPALSERLSPVSQERVPIPLSAQQESFFQWMYATPEPRDVGPVSVGIRITDEFDVELLERSLAELVRRHEALRTVFDTVDGRPQAYVLPECPPQVLVFEAQGADSANRAKHAAELACAQRVGRFDLATGPLVRAIVIRVDTDDHVLVLSVHHLVFDGWSMGVLLRELGLVYSALSSGRPSPLPPLAVSCSDFFTWTREQWTRTNAFWERTLAGAPAAMDPFPGRIPATWLRSGAVQFRIEPAVTERLRAAAREASATTFMVVATGWAATLSRWSGATDLVLMTPVPGRNRPELESLIGCLVQSLLLRIDLSGDPSLAQLLTRVRADVLGAVDHQFYPFAQFHRRMPDAGFIRFESWGASPHFPGLVSEAFELPREMSAEWPTPNNKIDIGIPELAMVEQPDGALSGWLLYNAVTFEQATIEQMAQSFVDLCARLVDEPHQPLF